MKLGYIDYVKKYIKLIWAYPNYRGIFEQLKITSGRRAILIGTPIHGNLGDHLIGVECINYINTLEFDSLIEVPEFVYELFGENIDIRPCDAIFISGGGWMGDLYEDEIIIEEIVENHPDNLIVILPQTIYFSNGENSPSAKKLKVLTQNAKKLIICTREYASYKFALDILKINKENCFLLPDAALLHKKLESIKGKSKKILFSLRNDAEKVTSSFKIKKLEEELSRLHYTYGYTSTVLRRKVVPLKMRRQCLDSKIREFSEAEIVITDRLHSMIVSDLAGTKCIAIDNSTHKVKGVYQQWLRNNTNIIVLDEMCDLGDIKLIDNLYKQVTMPYEKDFSEFYGKLSKRIKEVQV